MASNSNNEPSVPPKTKWVTIGKLWKNRQNPDKLRGHIEIEGVRFNIFAFIQTPVQKKFNDEEDIRIAMIVEDIPDEDNPFHEE